MNGKIKISASKSGKSRSANFIEIIGASQFNLKNINVKIPLGLFTVITGVSGSGKSTLINEIFYKALAHKIYGSKDLPGVHKYIKGIEKVDKIILVDQSPIGRTHANPATYTGVFGEIRKLFGMLPQSRIKGYSPGRFSFNVKGGRCESCGGDGTKKISQFCRIYMLNARLRRSKIQRRNTFYKI